MVEASVQQQQQLEWIRTSNTRFKWVRAVGVAGLTLVALRQLPAYHPGLEFALVLLIAILASVSLPGAILLSLLAIGFPVFYSSPVVGIAFAIAAVGSFQYLTMSDARAFFLVGFMLVAVYLKLEWAFPLLAGFYLATANGFGLAFCAVALVEIVGLLLGRTFVGSIYTHGAKSLWTISATPLPPLSDWGWVSTKLTATPPLELLGAFARLAMSSGALIVQPLAWGAVAAFVGAAAEKRWKNLATVLPLAAGALLLVTSAISSIYDLPGGILQVLLRAVLGLGAAAVPITVTMVVDSKLKVDRSMETAEAPELEAAPPQTTGSIDSLTGLFRREHLDLSLPVRFEDAERSDTPLAFCMIDLDRFKQINDTKGHQAGDRVLSDVAKLLRGIVATAGDVVRYGGDEFCVILPGYDAEGARQMMNNAAGELERHSFTGLENVLRPTFSIGIAEFPRMASTQEDLIEYADQALYISKNMGRNTITVYGEQVFREQALELTCWMAMQCFLTVNGRIRADSWRLHAKQQPIEIVTAFDYTATIPYVSKTASLVTEAKTFKSSFEGKILRIVSMSDNQTQFILLVQKADLPLKIQEHLDQFEIAQD